MSRIYLTNSENKFVLSQLVKSGVTSYINSDLSFYTIDKYLVIACQKANLVLIKYLLKRGANINSFGSTFRLPIWWSIYNGEYESVKLLLKYGAKINFYDSETGITPIELAVSLQNMQLVRLLLKSGATQNVVKLPFYNTEDPIFICLKNRNFRMLKSLLKSGFTPNIYNSFGISALKLSINNRCLTSMKLLVKYGAYMHRESDGYCIFKEILNDNYSSALQVFLDEGFNPLTNPVSGTHPIDYCVFVSAIDCASLLALNGAVYNRSIPRLLVKLDSKKIYKLKALVAALYFNTFTISSLVSAYSDYHFPYGNIPKSDMFIHLFGSNFSSILQNNSSVKSLQYMSSITILRHFGLHRIKVMHRQGCIPNKYWLLLKSCYDEILNELE